MSIYEAHPGYSSAGDKETLLEVYESARERPKADVITHLGQIVLKTVSGCNFDCKSNGDTGYDCYEYVTDDWRDRPPVLTDEVAQQVGTAVGEYAAQNTIAKMTVTLHGGEPLFVPKDLERPSQRPHDYYDRILPLIKQAMREAAPQTSLQYSMQTNGSLLHVRNLEMLKEHDVRTSVSLDGPASTHNQSRVIMHNNKRIGTYQLVQRGLQNLMKKEYADIYRGIICVVDIQSDPIAVLAELQRYHPPIIDLHLPYGTWQDMPPGLRDHPLRKRDIVETLRVYHNWTQAEHSPRDIETMLAQTASIEAQERRSARRLFEQTRTAPPEDVHYVIPYAAWLRTFYVANQQSEHPLDVRLFSSIERMSLGGRSSTEAIGPRAGGEVIVRTDGSIELPDSLRVTRSGSEKTDYTIFDHSLEEVAETLRAHHHLGQKSISDTCGSCDLQQICGGGHVASRYSLDREFNNPSVYCPDLEDLIRFIRSATIDTQTPLIRQLTRKRTLADEARRTLASYVSSPDWEL